MYLKEGASESLGLLLRWGQDHGHESNSRSQVHAGAFEACRGVEIMMCGKGCRKQGCFCWKKIYTGVLRLKWHRMLRRLYIQLQQWLPIGMSHHQPACRTGTFQELVSILKKLPATELKRTWVPFSWQLSISWYFQWSSVVHPQKFRMMSLSSELTKLTAERLGRNPFCETIIEAVMQVLQ